MNSKERKARLRAEVGEESREDAEQEVQMEERLRGWRRRTLRLGLALVLCIGAIVPFAEGQPLHHYAGRTTKFLVYLAMCLLAAFMYAAGTSYVVRNYLRDIRRIHKKFAPPASQHRTR